MLNRITQLIKRACLTLVGKDNTDFPIGQVTYNRKVGNIELVFPYGLCANPPLNSLVLMFNVLAEEENRAGIANQPQSRFKDLKEGEVCVGNYLTKSFVKFNAEGGIEITSLEDLDITVVGPINITAPAGINVISGGDVSIDGTGHTINLKGSYNIGGLGGAAIARVGDSVLVNGQTGHITSGSSHHNAT